MKLVSPVTGTNDVSLIKKFDVETIRSLYLKETKVDVSRFFPDLREIALYECNETGYRFYYPFTIFGDDQFYQDLHRLNDWYYQDNRWEHPLGMSFLKPDDKILEIGSGDGFFIELCKKNKIQHIMGLELNTEAAAKATEKGLIVQNEYIQNYSSKHQEEFDVVCNFQVLEHIAEVKSFLDASIKALKIGGKLIIAVPNNNPFLFKWDEYHTLNLPPHHAGLWNKEVFKKLENYFPLKQIEVHTEPLGEISHWYHIQKKEVQKSSPVKAFLMSLIPKFIYKWYIKRHRERYEGRNILVVFEKINNK